MEAIVSFDVPGRVRGQGRPRFARGGRAYKAREDREREGQIRAAFLEAAVGAPALAGPVAVVVDVWRALPASAPRSVASEPDVHRPDADNVGKSVLDALNGVAWADDAQVTVLRVEKHDRARREERMRVCVMDAAEYRAWAVGHIAPDLGAFSEQEEEGYGRLR